MRRLRNQYIIDPDTMEKIYIGDCIEFSPGEFEKIQKEGTERRNKMLDDRTYSDNDEDDGDPLFELWDDEYMEAVEERRKNGKIRQSSRKS